ncbi:MAG: hypothetical protein KTR25_18150 [Myxococcales bacterium]|nr:hypothetical protein [Myxococcales bacterium]
MNTYAPPRLGARVVLLFLRAAHAIFVIEHIYRPLWCFGVSHESEDAYLEKYIWVAFCYACFRVWRGFGSAVRAAS